MSLATSSVRSIRLDANVTPLCADALCLSSVDLTRMSSGDGRLVIGSNTTSSIEINAADAAEFSSTTYIALQALHPRARIIVNSSAASFYAMSAISDDAIIVDGDITTRGGHGLYLSTTGTNASGILLATNVTLFANSSSSSNSSRLSIIGKATTFGRSTLRSVNGIILNADLTLESLRTADNVSSAPNTPYTAFIDASVGVLTVSEGRTLTGGPNYLVVSAMGLDLLGGILMGAGSAYFATPSAIVIGDIPSSASSFHISNDELNRISTQGVYSSEESQPLPHPNPNPN